MKDLHKFRKLIFGEEEISAGLCSF